MVLGLSKGAESMMKIAVTGPESSGKTTLSRTLAEKLNVVFIPEFARTYIEEREGVYTESDLIPIAHGQKELLDKFKDSSLVSDTDFLVLKIWSSVKFQHVAKEIEDLYANTNFDLFVLCKPDIPWEADPLRENPSDRDYLFELYLRELKISGKRYITVQGTREERVNQVLQAITKGL
jgi:nicotinamide riboside kinase